jgi:hypothetical protein
MRDDINYEREQSERYADRERERERVVAHDDNEPTTFERTDEPLLKKLMGDDFDKYFGEDEKQAKYYWDGKYAI